MTATIFMEGGRAGCWTNFHGHCSARQFRQFRQPARRKRKKMDKFTESIVAENFFCITSDNFRSFGSKFYGFAFIGDTLYCREDPQKGKLDPYTAGMFTNIVDEGDCLHIQQDFWGGFGLYVYRDSDYWAVSNSLFHLIDALSSISKKLTINEDYLALHMVIHLVPTSITETIINEISELPQGLYLTIDKLSGKLDFHKYEYNNYSIKLFSEEGAKVLDQWRDKYNFLIKGLLDSGNSLEIQLSGGMDSRACFSLVKDIVCSAHSGNKLRIYCRNDDQYTHAEDFRIASKISEIFNFQLNTPVQCSTAPTFFPDTMVCELYTKFFMSDSFIFTNAIFLKPFFCMPGYGGETFRDYYFGSAQNYIDSHANFPTLGGLNLNTAAKSILERVFSYINANYSDPLDDASKLYNYTFQKNHFMRYTAAEYMRNRYLLSPFLDPMLCKLNISPKVLPNRDIFFAVIYDRYIPELNDLGFNGNRIINPKNLDEAKKFNRAFPPEASSISKLGKFRLAYRDAAIQPSERRATIIRTRLHK